jgi:hypothetical protein
MNLELRNELTRYVKESERTIQAGEEKCKVLTDEVQTCRVVIGNLQNEVRNLEAIILRQQAALDLRIGNEKVEKRKRKRNDTYSKKALAKALGCSKCCEDSPLFHAALGFMKGSQLKSQIVGANEDQMVVEGTKHDRRCNDKGRKSLLTQMVTYMFDGEVLRDIEASILRKKRFCTVTLARVSDMNSTFNPSALGCISKCEGGKVKGEMGLLCGESTLRRTMDLVHDQAVQLGFSFMPTKGLGKVWCWGEDDSCLLTKAVNMYVKSVYCDARCSSITQENPWILPVTGDLVRTSTRGRCVTVMGPKQSDARLTNQERTGKSMCQSRGLYTPAVAGFATEGELMEYFHLMIREFQKIETQGFCIVNGYEWEVHIKVVVVADMSFLHKYVQRGGSSHSSACFCMLCSAFRDFRHEGYCGGCRKCRRRGIVYGKDGLQQCLHYEACTPEFLSWQKVRYEQLCELVPAIPLSALPAWTTVDELRLECIRRCVGDRASELEDISRTSGKGYYTGEDLTNWIIQYCRGGCTLSNDIETGVMFCDIAIVKKCLLERHNPVPYVESHQTLRLRMQEILQLEQEFTKMTLCMRDGRFSSRHSISQALPLDRLIICFLHCPMRTHEKVLTLLMQQACSNRLPTKSRPILDDISIILRRIGKLPDTWSYKMDEKNKSLVSKIKMHFDQSKHIFKEHNMVDLHAIIELAIPRYNQANWKLFIAQYIKCIDLMTVSRDYTVDDILQLELHCDETYRLLVAHCGGKAAVTNYFHYIGAGHVVWMCRNYGNIWRFRNEGVEAFNKTLSKRANMFNSAGNKGRMVASGKVKPFEVLGKWMGRYVMWQLEFAHNLFIEKGELLGKSEITWDTTSACFIADEDLVDDIEDEDCDFETASEGTDSDSDLDEYTPEDMSICEQFTF